MRQADPDARLRIAQISPSHFAENSVVGGGERYVQYLSRGLRAGFPEIELTEIYLSDKDHHVVLNDHHRIFYFSAARFPNGKSAPSSDVIEAIRTVDVVHIHQPFTTFMECMIFSAKFLNKIVIATDHGWVDAQRGRQFDHFGFIDEYVTNSVFGAHFLKEHTRAPVTVVRGGVDTDAFTPLSPVRRGGYFLSVGRILPHKNLEMQIAALPAGSSLVICGRNYDDGYARFLLELSKGKDIDFIFDASDAEIVGLYRGATATALCSTYYDSRGNYHRQPELMGFTLLESMACGTPVICTRVGGMPEYVDEGVTGFVVDTVADLRRVFAGLQSGRYDSEALGRQARTCVVERYSASVVAAEVMKVYRRRAAAVR